MRSSVKQSERQQSLKTARGKSVRYENFQGSEEFRLQEIPIRFLCIADGFYTSTASKRGRRDREWMQHQTPHSFHGRDHVTFLFVGNCDEPAASWEFLEF